MNTTATICNIDTRRRLTIDYAQKTQITKATPTDKYQEQLLRKMWLALIRDYYPSPIVSEMEVFFRSHSIIEVIESGIAASEILLGRECTINSPFCRLVSLTDSKESSAVRKTLSVCRFGKRYTVQNLNSSLDSFWETNNRLKRWDADEHAFVLDLVRNHCLIMLSDYDQAVAQYRESGKVQFSTGADADGSKDLVDKIYATEQYYPMLFGPSLGTPWFNVNTSMYPPDTNKIKSVPKNYKKSRHIAMEPQWKSVMAAPIAYALEQCLPAWADIRDQDHNRYLAYLGSTGRTPLATIDLSAASDSIGIALCKAILPENVFNDLLAVTCRSQRKRTDKWGREKMHYDPIWGYVPNEDDYAMISTMGNRVTFPLETLVFSACVLTAKELYERYADNQTVLLESNLGVYGDDIIVPCEMAPTLVDVLTACGFIVNDEKSFMDPTFLFRESCGAEYWQGQAVDTYYWPRVAISKENALVHLVPLQHKFYKLPYTNEVICNEIYRLCPKMTQSYPESAYDDIWSDYPDIKRVFGSYSKGYTEPEPSCEVHTVFETVKGSSEWSEGLDRYRYYEFLRIGHKDHDDPVLAAVGYPADQDRTRGLVHPALQPKNRKFLM